MHTSSIFKETNLEILYQFIQDYPLGTLITSANNSLDADHLPFILNRGNMVR